MLALPETLLDLTVFVVLVTVQCVVSRMRTPMFLAQGAMLCIRERLFGDRFVNCDHLVLA